MYEAHEIEISYKYLKTVVGRLEEPICLIGGWAVYHHVNKNFKKATGRNYIGSRDIDLGFHFEKDWSEKELRESTFAKSLRSIEEELGFVPVGFRYLKEFHIETEKELSKDEVKTTPLHFVFPLYIDPVVDIIHPKFYEVFKFNPVDEPLLEMVFVDKDNRMTEKSFGKNLWLPKPHILLATKSMTHFDILIRIYFTSLSNKFIKFNRIEGKCLRFTEKIQDYIFKLRIKRHSFLLWNNYLMKM